MLIKPAQYFPIEKSLYEVKPGLRALNTDFGNGPQDNLLFQIDSRFEVFRKNKLKCRKERLSKYFVTHALEAKAEIFINHFLIQRLLLEHPNFFQLRSENEFNILECKLTHETLYYNSQYSLIKAVTQVTPPYSCLLDALCSQFQEDLASIFLAPDGKDYLSLLHLCSPSHWAAEEKIGKNFFEVHKPIPGIEKINAASKQFVEAMIYKGPYVRFVWGISQDTELNHHPENYPHYNHDYPFVVRIERQVTYGLPEINMGLFFIHVYFMTPEEILQNEAKKDLLKSALLSMSPESLSYKGVGENRETILRLLS
jgi:hypothetical protein